MRTVFDLILNLSFIIVWAHLLGLQFTEIQLNNRSLCVAYAEVIVCSLCIEECFFFGQKIPEQEVLSHCAKIT